MARSFLLLDFPERLRGWQKILPYALLLSITFTLYSASLYFQFVWDDVAYVTKNYRIQGLDWVHVRAFWTGTYLGHYAPVQHSLLALLYSLFGIDPFGYHLAQLVLHGACVCLVYILLRKLESARIALLACLLFVVHPANVETVAWVSENKSTLAFFFFLLSFFCFIRMRERERWIDGVLAGLFLVLSVLAKINTVVAPAVFFLYDYKQGSSLKNWRWRSLLPFFAISGLFVLIHLRVAHGSVQSMDSEYYGGLAVHLMNLPLLLSFYLQMIVFPYSLSAWEMFPAQEHLTWLVVLGWAGLFALAGVLVRSNRRTQFWGLWIFVFLLPVLQIVPFPIWVADRYLYIPAIGGFVLIGTWFFRAWESVRRAWLRWALGFAMAAAILLLAWRTERQVPVWTNDLTLWTATTQTCMMSAYCHMNLSLALLQDGQRERGIREMLRASELRQGPRVLERLGDVFTQAAHDYRQAVIAYNMALQQTGPSPISAVYGKLARAHYLAGDLEEAKRVIETGKTVNPNDPDLWIADGFVKWKEGDWDEARLSFRRSLGIARRTSNTAAFFTEFLGRPGEVGKMLSDLRQ